MVSTATPQTESGGSSFRFDWAGFAGALGDLVCWCLSRWRCRVTATPTAVLLPAGCCMWWLGWCTDFRCRCSR